MLSLISFASLCFVALMILVKAKSSSPKQIPPGPRGLPVAGNAFQIPSRFLFRKLCEWQKQFGDIYTISAFGQNIVVLGSAAVASDILDRMASATSGRPTYALATLVVGEVSFASGPYGELWRRHRRIAHENLNVRAAGSYRSLQAKGAADLVQGLAEPQSDLHHALIVFSGTTIWRALYGETTSDMEDRIKRMGHAVQAGIKLMSPTASLANLFPSLLGLPAVINPWKAYGDKKRKEITEFGINCVREGSSLSTETTFVASCMNAMKATANMTETEVAWIAMTLFGAGAETTAFTLHFFILAMLLYPEEAKKAQRVVDSVVGDRVPTFEDRDQLAYIDAIIREVLRWRPVAPLGLPHLATEDLTYDGYSIPKGAFIMPNVWHINHNSAVFSDPDVFCPERYLDSNGKLKPLGADYHDGILAFGYAIAHLLWSFDFCKAVNERGEDITPSSTDFVDENILIYPSSFPYVLKPRRDLSDAFNIPN